MSIQCFEIIKTKDWRFVANIYEIEYENYTYRIYDLATSKEYDTPQECLYEVQKNWPFAKFDNIREEYDYAKTP